MLFDTLKLLPKFVSLVCRMLFDTLKLLSSFSCLILIFSNCVLLCVKLADFVFSSRGGEIVPVVENDPLLVPGAIE